MNTELEQSQLHNINNFVADFSNIFLEVIKQNNFDVNDLKKIFSEEKEGLIENTATMFKALLEKKDLVIFDSRKPVWRILTMGNYENIDQLIRALEDKTKMVNYLKTIITNSDIVLAPKLKRYHLAISTYADLVIDQHSGNGLKYEQLMEIYNKTGRYLCPTETALQLILQGGDVAKYSLLPLCKPFLGSKAFCLILGELRVVDVKSDWQTICKLPNLKVVYLV